MLQKLILIALVFASTQAIAQEKIVSAVQVDVPAESAQYIVKQIIKSHKLVVVQTNATTSFAKEKIFLATFSDGNQCSLVLKETNNQLLTLDTSSCELGGQITLKTSIEPSLVSVFGLPKAPVSISDSPVSVAENTKVIEGSSSAGRVGHVAMTVHYSFGDQAKFDDGRITTSGGAGNINTTYDVDRSLGVGISYLQVETNSWGYQVGGFYETQRELKSVTFSGSGGTISGSITGVRPKLSFLVAEMNAVYRFNQVYIPFGFNVSSPMLEDGDGANAKGNLGVQVGVGFFLNKRVLLDVFVRTIGMTLAASSGTTYADFGYGTIGGAGVGLKYLF